MDQEDIKNRFTYHKPDNDKIVLHERIRRYGFDLSTYLNEVLPDGREKSLAVTKIEEAIMWANASLARSNT
jgi:hypothetical protein